MLNKFENLKQFLLTKNEQGLCLAFSGGIDSTLLLYLCKDLNIVAVTFYSDFQTSDEILQTKDLCCEVGVKHIIIPVKTLENKLLSANPKNRCYYCKKNFFSELKNFSEKNNLKYIFDGTNFDDLSTFRPGIKALKEMNVSSPLADFEISKKEIREYSKILGIKIFNKPSTPCLATRFPYGTKLTKELLLSVELAEKIIKNFGFENNRFRIHGNIARIEIPQKDFRKFFQLQNDILLKLKPIGIKYLTLDIEGLRSGSMD